MGTVDKIKERKNNGTLLKACPICGSAPTLIRFSLDCGNGHGYPGNYKYHFECSGCGIIKSGDTTDIYDTKQSTAEQRSAQDWNEIVDYINELIAKKQAKEKNE